MISVYHSFLGSTTLRADINSQYVVLLNNQFISPISAVGPELYVYYLVDSQVIDHYKCYKIRFAPRSLKLSKLEGEMWIADSFLCCEAYTPQTPDRI